MDTDKVRYWSELSDYDFEQSPMSHNLINIAQSCGLNSLMSEEQKSLISELMPLNIESRYPSYKQSIAGGLTEERCQRLIESTKSLQIWIKERL